MTRKPVDLRKAILNQAMRDDSPARYAPAAARFPIYRPNPPTPPLVDV